MIIGVDIGGTKIATAEVAEDGTRGPVVTIETPPGPDVAGGVAESVRRVAEGRRVHGIGIGAAGFVAADRRTVLFAPNIDWTDHRLADEVESLVGAPVVVENDANAAAWGEYRFGAARDTADVLLVTIGTGVGGGIVQDGRLQRGAHGIGGEIGHIRLIPDGLLCGCGQRGCLEQYGSGTALDRLARERCGPDTSGPAVTRRALRGDSEALAVVTEVARHLGAGIATLVAVLDPAVIVIGGGVAESGDVFLNPIREAMAAGLSGVDQRVRPALRLAQLGNDAGLIGSADLARHMRRTRD